MNRAVLVDLDMLLLRRVYLCLRVRFEVEDGLTEVKPSEAGSTSVLVFLWHAQHNRCGDSFFFLGVTSTWSRKMRVV